MEDIPDYVKGTLLPPNNLNILEITSVATPSVANPPALLLIKELFSKKQSIIQDAAAARVLLGLCIPSAEDLPELKARVYETKRSGFISFFYPVHSMSTIQLPFWVLDFGEAAHRVINSKVVLFEQLPWTGTITAYGPIRVVQLSSKCLSTALSEEPCSSGSASEAPPLAASLDENTLPDDDFSMDL